MGDRRCHGYRQAVRRSLPPLSPERVLAVVRLFGGLVLCGIAFALLVRADLGLDPWNVLHQGVSRHTGIPIGTVTIGVGIIVLLGWIPLRERPGVGTVANTVVIGGVIDLLLPRLPVPHGHGAQWVMLATGLALAGPGIGLYIGARLGPGPRDGLMTGLAKRGHSVRVVRTALELAALAVGWLLGGTIGIGTLVFALTIGPLVHFWLPRLDVGRPPADAPPDVAVTPAD